MQHWGRHHAHFDQRLSRQGGGVSQVETRARRITLLQDRAYMTDLMFYHCPYSDCCDDYRDDSHGTTWWRLS